MKVSTKKRIRVALIFVISVSLVLLLANFIMAIYVFELIKDKNPDAYSKNQIVETFSSKEEVFAKILEEVNNVELSNIFIESDTVSVKGLFPFEASETCFDKEQKLNISSLSAAINCDEIAVRGKTSLLIIFYDTQKKPFTFSHSLSDAQSYDSLLENSRSLSPDGETREMGNGWIFYQGI